MSLQCDGLHCGYSGLTLLTLQGPRAEALIRSAMDRGKWVFFQNCHLAPSWMPNLERLIEAIDPDKVGCAEFIIFLYLHKKPNFFVFYQN